MSVFKDLSGLKFNRLLVLNKAGKNIHNKIMWNVICDCGIKKQVLGYSLTSGQTQSCGCFQKKRASESNKQFDSNPALRKLIDSYRNSAKKRGYKFLPSLEEADFYFQQSCFYCGRPPHRIFTEYNGKYIYMYNGIDRINNLESYIKDNIITSCKDCNYAKNEMSIKEFQDWIIKVYENFVLKIQVNYNGQI